MFNLSQREFQKEDRNFDPLLLKIFSGRPNFENICLMKMLARSSEVIVVVVSTKITILVKWLTTTRMELKQFNNGSWLMKSMDKECQGKGGIGRDLSHGGLLYKEAQCTRGERVRTNSERAMISRRGMNVRREQGNVRREQEWVRSELKGVFEVNRRL